MWKRYDLKAKAKNSIHNNYWRSVLAAIVISISLGSAAVPISFVFSSIVPFHVMHSRVSSYENNDRNYDGDNPNYYFRDDDPYDDTYDNDDLFDGIYDNDGAHEYDDTFDDIYDRDDAYDNDDLFDGIYDRADTYDNSDSFGRRRLLFAAIPIIVTVLAVSLIGLAIAIAIKILILLPLEVGGSRFMLMNLDRPAQIGQIGYSFDTNYKNILSTMFFRDLFICLWTLLFIIPGIVKAYEYRMIPYLLADHPEMTRKEAFTRSKAMMQGQKWNAFVLDLSFIGWFLLSALTFGILNIFYVGPYYQMTIAALYETLRDGNQTSGSTFRTPPDGTPGGTPFGGPDITWNMPPTDHSQTTPPDPHENGQASTPSGEHPVSDSRNESPTTTTNP
jgi:hypothetical protein